MRKRCRVGYLRLVRYPLATAGGLIEATRHSASNRPAASCIRWATRLAGDDAYPLATAGGLIEVEKVRLLHLAKLQRIRWPRLAASLKAEW